MGQCVHTSHSQDIVFASLVILSSSRTHTYTRRMNRMLYAGVVILLAGFARADDDTAPMINNAIEFLARASSTSEVLTLNLTNLLILLVLKALILGFGLFSVGGAGRSADSPAVTQSDMTGGMCFLMFTSGAEEKLDCIKRTACEDPYLASDYLTAAKMWYKMHKLMKSVIPFDEKYAKVMYAVKESADFGKTGADCSAEYPW